MIRDLSIIYSQQLPNGLTVAGGGDYDKIWIRDNVYVALAFAEAGLLSEAATIYNELCKIIAKYQSVLSSKTYPLKDSELIHPRFDREGNIIPGNWSNKQHDAIGVLLFGIGKMAKASPHLINSNTNQTAQQMIEYLEACHYFEDPDSGMWEEGPPKIHSSSLAACIRGIEETSDFYVFNQAMLRKAKDNLEALLPNESLIHPVNMALLSCVWPYGYNRKDIVDAIEKELLRDNGVIRYKGDIYESENQVEPEWVMGIPWLGIAHFQLGNIQKAKQYLEKTEHLYKGNDLPESYLASNKACAHTPLAWSHAMAIILRCKLASNLQLL